jgi:signal transduction histidine kinase
VRHSRATRITISLSYHADTVNLRIVDDGCGFDPKAQTAAHSTHWGLAIMNERARQIGGSLTITSVEGSGTTVDVSVPTATSFPS